MALISGVILAANGMAFAGPCTSVEREMVQGQTAFEIAKDNSDYEEAARLFEKATAKAPKCADAYYNLGTTYEKTTDYHKAINALETYLQLRPNAEDTAAVRKQIYRLEFLAEKKASGHSQKKEAATQRVLKPQDLEGLWQAKVSPALRHQKNGQFWVEAQGMNLRIDFVLISDRSPRHLLLSMRGTDLFGTLEYPYTTFTEAGGCGVQTYAPGTIRFIGKVDNSGQRFTLSWTMRMLNRHCQREDKKFSAEFVRK